MNLNVADLTAPSFDELFWDILDHKHMHYWLKGGRGSTKSSFISIMIPLMLMQNENYNAVVLRKVANTLKKSVFNQILWGINELEIRHLFKVTTSPLEITRISTGQKIVFLGCDDPTKVKSIKFEVGYAAINWKEELDQFSGMEEIGSINKSLNRGGEIFWNFYSYNPPRSVNNWVNEEMLVPKENRLVHHSTYLTVPMDWLGGPFFEDAEHQKIHKRNLYDWEYMGEAIGTGGNVFDNVTLREITDEEIEELDKIYHGQDFGFTVDPASYVKCYYHNNRLIFLDEIYETGLSNKMLYDKLIEKGIGKQIISADGAEPKSISELRSYGLNIYSAKKGPDSVNFGMKWLQKLDEIVIDKRRTPSIAKEFVGYEYDRNKDGQFISRYPDKNNHAIDATRYALRDQMEQNKWGW